MRAVQQATEQYMAGTTNRPAAGIQRQGENYYLREYVPLFSRTVRRICSSIRP
jgi:hypothetical protein